MSFYFECVKSECKMDNTVKLCFISFILTLEVDRRFKRLFDFDICNGRLCHWVFGSTK